MFLRFSILSLALILLLPSCKKEEKQMEKEEAAIKSYASNKGWQITGTGSGLFYVVLEEGNGNFPSISSEVTVNYIGRLEDESIFDENDDISFPLQNVIKGWQEGIPKFSEGGGGALLVPSRLGYGEQGSGSVPGDAIMIFEVDLLEVDG